MGLKEDAKGIICELLGQRAADTLEVFQDPLKYPDEFLEECEFFLSKLIGERNAKIKFEPLRKKYIRDK